MRGIVEGCNRAAPEVEAIDLRDIWLLCSRSEIFDVHRMVIGARAAAEPFVERHATSVVRLFADHADLLIRHAAWRSYSDSIRLSKQYRLPFRSRDSAIQRRSLSGFPLIPHADEGLTITDQAMAVTATTIALANDSCFAHVSSI